MELSDFRAVVLGDATIAALVGTRMYPSLLPQNPTLPALTYQQVSGVREVILDGPVDLVPFRIQVDCYAWTTLERDALAKAVRLKLHGFSGDVGGSPPTWRIGLASLDNEQDNDEPEQTPKIFRKILDFLVYANEDVTA